LHHYYFSCNLMTKRDLIATRSFYIAPVDRLLSIYSNRLLEVSFSIQENGIYHDHCCCNATHCFFLIRQHNEQHVRRNNGQHVRSQQVGRSFSGSACWFIVCCCSYFCLTICILLLEVLKSYIKRISLIKIFFEIKAKRSYHL
jgi:hypothetical protein